MAKRDDHYKAAKELYVTDMLTYEQIAERLPVSDRTLREWGKSGQWAEQRESVADVEDLRGKSHEKLHKLMDRLLDKAIKNIEEGDQPNQGQLNFIRSMAPALVRLQTYEESAQPDPTAPVAEKPKQLSEDLIRLIEEQLLGIKRP